MQFQKAILLLALISFAISSAKKHKKTKESKEKVSKHDHENEAMMARESPSPRDIIFDEPDPCLKPKPQRSNATNAHLWFYYNQEKRRCETFPYDGQVSPGSGYSRYGLEYSRIQNRFEFFQDCFKTCEEHMKLGDLQVKNPKKCFEPYMECRRMCHDEHARTYFTFNKDDLECVEIKSCCPSGNVYRTLNDCRKNCHFTSE